MDYNSREYDKMCNTFTDYNEYVITGWMINRLQLKGNELVVFALIHAYSQAYGWYMNSQQYTADATGVSKVSVNNSLKKLVEKDLLIKEEYTVGMTNSKLCKYKVNLKKVDELCRPGKETLPPGKETCYNNIYNNNIYNNNNNKYILEQETLPGSKEVEKEDTTKIDLVEELFNDYTQNDKLYDTLMEFRDFRKEKKKPLTERTAKMILKKLNELKSDKDKIACLEKSIMSDWTGIFPNSNDNTPKKKNLHDESDLKGTIRHTNGRKQ